MNLKKFWRRKSVAITESDPTYKVIYLGNVLTGWAKGDGCVEKPLATLWRNYCQSNRPDISMKVSICSAGLRAVTREHGLTEYWAHRVTHCSAHPAYPRVFCWVYRHEGRRLKQELRCHAVLCPKQGKAEVMSEQLKERLSSALHEFRREKTIRQNARLSLVSAVYDTAALPMRRMSLITGSANYRPPLDRSKSAPKLSAIEENREEEEEEEYNEDDEERLRRIAQKTLREAMLRSQPLPYHSYDVERTQVVKMDKNAMSGEAALFNDCHINLAEDDDDNDENFGRFTRSDGIRNFHRVDANYSSSNLLFFQSQSEMEQQPVDSLTLKDGGPDLALLDAFKGKLALSSIASNAEESLTSDQPESISSHSCSSSCDGGADDEIIIIEVGTGGLMEGKRRNCSNGLGKLGEEEEDNISEESGYSEDKECMPHSEITTIKVM